MSRPKGRVSAGPPCRRRTSCRPSGRSGGAGAGVESDRFGGTDPRWLISQRVRASLPLLETSQASVEEVSAAVGFESPGTYRHHFTKIMRISPSAYRRGFRTVQVAREGLGPMRAVAP
ncbi:helix-turn-helix domain-containing protein [Streptomyces sp. AC495_CC817]|uniref:helix-turn-helix domain-containing protein n=1 Tax=Streptomyces sp. AC495_CC817 TaxID=2823900 RepID=UPI001C280A9F|nr:helix-turn-helix domain-containing protein [Streptomyces sp. AC495_CC817]